MAVLAAPVVGWIAAGVAAAGAVYQGIETNKANKDAARRAEEEADHNRMAASFDAANESQEGERAIGAGVAAAGASGFDISGSAIGVLADLARQRRYNTTSIIYGGDMERRRLLAEAKGYRRAGKAAMTNGILQAGAAMLGGAAQMRQSGNLGAAGGASSMAAKKPMPTTRSGSMKATV